MPEKIAVAHAPEGAGNAIRMLAIASELKKNGKEVVMAGGGPGSLFVELNGFEEFEPATVDFIDEREAGGLKDAILKNGPQSVRRFQEFSGWLEKEKPAAVVTDDPFAAFASKSQGTHFFRVDHSKAEFYDSQFERNLHRLFNWFSIEFGEEFFFTCVSPDTGEQEGVKKVNPLVLEPENPEKVEEFDVLLVPGTYSKGFDRLAENLRQRGFRVKMVGDDDWKPVPAMLPYYQEADVVVCTGFSSVSEAVVAGTPCVLYPFIDCQNGVARSIEREESKGIAVVNSIDEALEKVEDPPEAMELENGAPEVAAYIADWLADNGFDT